MTRVGIVGAGGVAQRHARVLAALPDVQVVGVTDVISDAARSLAEAHGASCFQNIDDLLAARLDAAYVCVPPYAHGPAERAIVAAEVPMFIEKPIAVNMAVAEEIANLIAERGLLTAVGHHWRYLGVVEQARTLLADRPVRLVSGAWLDKVPPVGWWPHAEQSGGPIVEQAAHVLDLVRHLAGEVSEVYAAGNGMPAPVPGADVDGATVATLRFASGAVGTLATTCVLDWKQRAGLEVYAEGLALSLTESALVVRDANGAETVEVDPDSARVAVDRAFIEAVRGESDDIRVPYAEALRTHCLALAVAESAAVGRPVRVALPFSGAVGG